MSTQNQSFAADTVRLVIQGQSLSVDTVRNIITEQTQAILADTLRQIYQDSPIDPPELVAAVRSLKIASVERINEPRARHVEY